MEISGKGSPFGNYGMGGLAVSMNSSLGKADGSTTGGVATMNSGFPSAAFPGMSPVEFGMLLQSSEQQLQMFAKAQQLHMQQQHLQQQMSAAAAIAMKANSNFKHSTSSATSTITAAQTDSNNYSNEDSPSDFSYSTNGSSSPAQNILSSPTENILSSSPHTDDSKANINGDISPVINDIKHRISPVIDRKPVVRNLLPNSSSMSRVGSPSPPHNQPPTLTIEPSPSGTAISPSQGLLAIKQPMVSPALTNANSPITMAQASMGTVGSIFANQMAAAFAAQQQALPVMPTADPVSMAMNPLMGPGNAIARALSLGNHQQRRPRSEKKSIPADLKDNRYFERRKRNNQAAKKSRDARKYREDEIAVRANFLEKENAVLRAQVSTLREEANSLRQLMLQKRSRTGQ